MFDKVQQEGMEDDYESYDEPSSPYYQQTTTYKPKKKAKKKSYSKKSSKKKSSKKKSSKKKSSKKSKKKKYYSSSSSSSSSGSAKVKPTITGGEYSGKYIPGMPAQKEEPAAVVEPAAEPSTMKDLALMDGEGQPAETAIPGSETLVAKNITANGAGDPVTGKGSVEKLETSLIERYSRHIVISIIVLVFLVFRLKGGASGARSRR